jgi:hypothetical protein
LDAVSVTSFLRPYQDEASDHLARALVENGFALDASATGVGKTFHALAVVEKLEAPQFIVVCRAVARDKWRSTIENVGLADRCVHVDSWDKFRNGSLSQFVVRTKATKKAKPTFSWAPLKHETVVIFDEAQDAGGYRSSNAELLLGAHRSKNAYALCLSASVADSPLRMYAIGFCTGLHTGIDFMNWCRRNGCSKSPFGGLYFKKCGQRKSEYPRHPRGCNCGETAVINNMHASIFPRYGVMIDYESIRLQLPPETIAIELWEPGPLPKSLHHLREAIEKKEEGDRELADQGIAIGGIEHTRERQYAELSKMPDLACQLADDAAAGYWCPVFLGYSGSIDALALLLDAASVTYGILDGRDKKRAKKAHADFMAGTVQVLITQYQAGSASIDMHDEVGTRPRRSYLSPFPAPEKMLQALGRSFRVNLKSAVQQTIFFAAGTVEENVYKVAHRRTRNIRAMSTGEWADSWN